MPKSRNVFISKPNSLTPDQQRFVEALKKILVERGLRPRTLGETDFPNETPLGAVRTLLSECEGCLVLGFTQMLVSQGISKPGSANEEEITGLKLPTPWNHIETGMAYMKNIPVMILCEKGISVGIFDKGITDRYIHQADLTTDWLTSPRFLQPFNDWFEEIVQTNR